MKQKYRIEIVGLVPLDLPELISACHASAILKSKNDNVLVRFQRSKDPNSDSIQSDTSGIREKGWVDSGSEGKYHRLTEI
jgi:hypothetical protein